MQRSKMLKLVWASLFTWLMAMGCGAPRLATDVSTETKSRLTVSAATSLQDVLDEIAHQFINAHPTIAIDYNFGASGALQRQIEQGAPVDIFFAAATQPMDELEQQDLIEPHSRQNILRNRLAVVAPLDSPLAIGDVSQLDAMRVSRLAVGEFRSVPAGQYTQQVFEKLNLLKAFHSKFVFGNNVRSVLAAVESGHVDLGIVYATDAAISQQTKVLMTVPANLHRPIIYPIALVQGSGQPEAAQAFIDFLTTDIAQSIFQDFGFGAI